MNVLVTGGAGYIGSHTVKELLRRGFHVTVLDNLSKGHRQAVPQSACFIQADIRDQDVVKNVLNTNRIDAVVHFASDSLVGESMDNPVKYYENNVAATLKLLSTMRDVGVTRIVFSSTAAVYGEPSVWPITENSSTNPSNVYGRTKLVIEWMLADFARAYDFRYVSLRYFNAAGSAADGSLGEDHTPETHLIPLILKTVLGQRPAIGIFGIDYPTEDGTCIRDYIHVTDLSAAHVLALEHLAQGGPSRIYNLGSETGFSVRDVVDTAKVVTGINFLVREEARRAGDPAVLVASSACIRAELGWKAICSKLDDIISSAWRWHKAHPYGYKDR